MERIAKGYRYFQENSSTHFGADDGNKYINSIIKEINNLTDNMNNYRGNRTNCSQLKGNIAEFWHSGTLNIDSARKGLKDRTYVPESNSFASPDIISNEGETFGSKYLANGRLSAEAQSISYFEKYSEYKKSCKTEISFDEFLKKRNTNPADVLQHDSIYNGQTRIVPKEQMDEAINWLERKIAKEGSIRPEQINRYKETLELLKDCVETKSGAKSIPFSIKDAEKLAKLAKEGEFHPSKYGITTEELVEFNFIMQQSVKAGLNAAIIAFVLKMGPQLYKAINFLIENGEIDSKQFNEIGFSALSGSSEGFIRGVVAAALTSSCKSGILGESLKTVNPSIIGAVTVIFMNVMKNSYEVASGRMTNSELINEMVRDTYISTLVLISGGITQSFIQIPVIGYMLGSLVGSMIGSITYEIGYGKLISFCVETGFTLFGLVEQDYCLPSEVIEQLGFDIFEFDKIELDTFEFDKIESDIFEFDKIESDIFQRDDIKLVIVRRGVLGFNRIGYV